MRHLRLFEVKVDVRCLQQVHRRETRVREFLDGELAGDTAHPPLPQTTSNVSLSTTRPIGLWSSGQFRLHPCAEKCALLERMMDAKNKMSVAWQAGFRQ